jgi:hypothetical protein
MDEMQLLREFAQPSELPERGDLAQAREKLVAATISTPKRAPVRKRLLWSGFTAVTVAAAVMAAVVLAPVDADAPPSPLPAAQPENDPARILLAAAEVARAKPEVEPRPDQFVYRKTRMHDGREIETWASADGIHDGLEIMFGRESEIAGCRNGLRTYHEDGKKVGADWCTPFPASMPDLPTNADDMLAYLHKSTHGEGDNLNDLGQEFIYLSDGYLRPAARAALYEAATKIPGLVVRHDAKAADGRSVIGITWNGTTAHAIGNSDEFLFDPETFVYLGSAQWGSTVSRGVVDKVRQLP